MRHQECKSGGIEEVGYDPGSRILEVVWRGGTISAHHDVSPHTFEAMTTAEKPCSYWHSHIKTQHPDVNKK